MNQLLSWSYISWRSRNFSWSWWSTWCWKCDTCCCSNDWDDFN